MSFDEVVQDHFPGSSPQAVFVRRAAVNLIQDHGFGPAGTLACVGVCRDELCRPLSKEVETMWGEAFDMSSLAGILTIGTTGLAAARAHAPVVNGTSRYVFFLFSHIGIGADGELGAARRPNQDTPTAACGALVALQQYWQSGRHSAHLDWQDLEQSLLKMRLAKLSELGETPELIELTKAAHRATVQDFESLTAGTFDLEREDFALVAGVQIHGPRGISLIWPGTTYVVVQGTRSEIWF